MVLTFVVALGTGVAAGLFLSRLPAISAATTGAGAHGAEATSLADDLQLDARQRRETRAIWEAARDKGHQFFTEVQTLQKARDEALVALLNEQQKVKYEKVAQDFADQFAALTAGREKTFAEAVAQTKNILNPQQQKRYEEILQKRAPGARDWPPPPVIRDASLSK